MLEANERHPMDLSCRLSLVVPCYNEAEVLPAFYERVRQVLGEIGCEWEIVFVDDGSTDGTAPLLNAWADREARVKVLHFARNLGHQVALTAGMDCAGGDIIVTLDADLQDPPEVIPALLERIGEGFDIVHAQRQCREGETHFKLATARAFYWLLSLLSGERLLDNTGDFRAFTRAVRLAASHFRERHRFLRGLFVYYGFRQAVVGYDRGARVSGTTKYTLRKMSLLAANGILSFSSAPLRGVMWIAIALWAVSVSFTIKAFVGHFIFQRTVPGWTSLVVLLTFFTGLNLFSLSVIGAYVGRIFEQGQGRPMYWCAATKNVDVQALAAANPDNPEMALMRQMNKCE
jgi:dolichol-phosphate mannosyltransferase